MVFAIILLLSAVQLIFCIACVAGLTAGLLRRIIPVKRK